MEQCTHTQQDSGTEHHGTQDVCSCPVSAPEHGLYCAHVHLIRCSRRRTTTQQQNMPAADVGQVNKRFHHKIAVLAQQQKIPAVAMQPRLADNAA